MRGHPERVVDDAQLRRVAAHPLFLWTREVALESPHVPLSNPVPHNDATVEVAV